MLVDFPLTAYELVPRTYPLKLKGSKLHLVSSNLPTSTQTHINSFVYRYRCFNLFRYVLPAGSRLRSVRFTFPMNSRVSGSDEVPITAELYRYICALYELAL